MCCPAECKGHTLSGQDMLIGALTQLVSECAVMSVQCATNFSALSAIKGSISVQQTGLTTGGLKAAMLLCR